MNFVFVGDDNVSHHIGCCAAKYVNLHRDGGFLYELAGFRNTNTVTDQILQDPSRDATGLIMCRLDCYVKRNGIQFTHLDYILILGKKVLRIWARPKHTFRLGLVSRFGYSKPQIKYKNHFLYLIFSSRMRLFFAS